MRLDQIHIVYFLGIGGIGMSALARWFQHQGAKVFGYDLMPSRLTRELEESGIQLTFKDAISALPTEVTDHLPNTLVVYTPAIPKDHPQLLYFQEQHFDLRKRAEVLGIITRATKAIAVAGTHGKTTTSSLIAHILQHSGHGVNAFVGGIMTNYDSNLIIGKSSDWTLVEADEFDRSFLHLSPDVAVVTAMDADHLDIYGDADELKQSFIEFINNIQSGGQLFIKEGLVAKEELRKDISITSYGIDQGEIHAADIQIKEGKFTFTTKGISLQDRFVLGLPGFHNVENAVAAIAVAVALEVDPERIAAAIESYKGVKRRFEYIINRENLVFIDDYAHHPKEIEALIGSVRALYSGRKITAIFQPHLYSRTRDFAEGFSSSLEMADEVILLPIYPAREKPIDGVNAEMLVARMDLGRVRIMSKEALVDEINRMELEVLLTIGAGDIDRLVSPIAEKLLNRIENVES